MNLFDMDAAKVLYTLRVKGSWGWRWWLFTYLSKMVGPEGISAETMLKKWTAEEGAPPRVVQLAGKHGVKKAEAIVAAVRKQILAGDDVTIPEEDRQIEKVRKAIKQIRKAIKPLTNNN